MGVYVIDRTEELINVLCGSPCCVTRLFSVYIRRETDLNAKKIDDIEHHHILD